MPTENQGSGSPQSTDGNEVNLGNFVGDDSPNAPEVVPESKDEGTPTGEEQATVDLSQTHSEPQTTEAEPEAPADKKEEATEAKPADEDKFDTGKWGLLPEHEAEIQQAFNKAVQKKHERVIAERTRADQAEAELTTTRQELETIKQNGPQAAVNPNLDAVENVPEVQKLRVEADKHKAVMKNAELFIKRLNSVDPNGNDPLDGVIAALKKVDINMEGRSSEEVQSWLENAKEQAADKYSDLNIDLKQVQREYRTKFMQFDQEATKQAVDNYPWMKDRTSPEFAMASQVVQQMPYLTKQPGYLLGVTDMVAGRMARLAKAKANGAAKPVAKPLPKQPGKPSASPYRPKTNKVAEAQSEFDKNPTPENLERAYAAQLVSLGK